MHLELLKIGPLTIYSYGFLTAVGFLAAFWYSGYKAKKLSLDPDLAFNACLTVLVFGYVGSKTLYLITILPDLVKDPSIFWVSISSGFVLYGGLIGGLVSGFIFSRIKKIDFLAYLDVIIIGFNLGQSFGRLGCLMAGCCYGKATDLWFGITFPIGSFAPSGIPLIPTQIIMCLGDLLLFFTLHIMSKYKKANGEIGAWYMILYSTGRFLVEFLRNDDRGFIGSLSTSQTISIFIFISGIVLMTILKLKGNKAKPNDSNKPENTETLLPS